MFARFVDAVAATYRIPRHKLVLCVPARSRARVMFRNPAAAPAEFVTVAGVVVARTENGAAQPLTKHDIDTCKELGLRFQMPELLVGPELPVERPAGDESDDE